MMYEFELEDKPEFAPVDFAYFNPIMLLDGEEFEAALEELVTQPLAQPHNIAWQPFSPPVPPGVAKQYANKVGKKSDDYGH